MAPSPAAPVKPWASGARADSLVGLTATSAPWCSHPSSVYQVSDIRFWFLPSRFPRVARAVITQMGEIACILRRLYRCLIV